MIQSIKRPNDEKIHELCNQLEIQHRDLIQQQLSELRRVFLQSQNTPNTKIEIIDESLNAQLGQRIGIDTCATIGGDNSGSISLDFNNQSTATNQTVEKVEHNSSQESIVTDTGNKYCGIEVKCVGKEQPEFEMLQQDFTDTLEEDRLQIEDENVPIENDGQEPPTKKLKVK